MSKCYTDDPLMAAIAIKYHGMRLQVKPHDREIYYEAVLEDVARNLQLETIRPHYIHPDSLHLLEPQVGDLVVFVTKCGQKTCGVLFDDNEVFAGKNFYETDNIVSIMMRYNKPFPEIKYD